MEQDSLKQALINFYKEKGEEIIFEYDFLIKAAGVIYVKDYKYCFVIPKKQKILLSAIFSENLYELSNFKNNYTKLDLSLLSDKPKKNKFREFDRKKINKKLPKQNFRNRWNRHG